MKVLFVGNYRDNTGYGHMSLNTIMALINAGADVTCRPIKLDDSTMELPQQVIEAENKSGGNFDAVIQNSLPSFFEYSGKIPLNVGYYCTETSRFDGMDWPQKINTMDKGWVCGVDSYVASGDSGVAVPLSIVPIAADISKYQRSYKNLSIRDQLRDSFIFYYVGEFNTRKNIRALIQAFHSEFDPEEPVELLLKTRLGNSQTREGLLDEIAKVKQSMKLYQSADHYKSEILITDDYSEEAIMRLHSSCDCFVSTSHGEAWCVPAFDAMALGKTPIVSNDGGFREYLNYNNAYLVSGNRTPVWGMTHNTFDGLYTGREHWFDVDITHLRICMREAYNDSELKKKKSLDGRKTAYHFSYDKVGKQMMEILSHGQE